MAKKKNITTNAVRIVNAAKIDCEVIEYETDGEVGADFGMEIAQKTGIPPEKSFKTLVVRGDKNAIGVCCIPCHRELDLKKVAKVTGDKKVEMIHVKELLALTGYIRGGVSPIGMKKKYPTYIDATAQSFDKIAVSGGVCGITLMMSPDDLQKVTECKFESIIKE